MRYGRWLFCMLLVGFVLLCSGCVQRNLQTARIANASQLGLCLQDTADGPYVIAVRDETAAQQGGISAGDLILACNGEEAANSAAVDRAIASSAEEKMQITLLRDGETMTMSVILIDPKP